MKEAVKKHCNRLFNAIPALKVCSSSILDSYNILKQCYTRGGKLLICGNGGSASDSEHIVGELMKSFLLSRKLDEKTTQAFKDAFPDNWNYLAENLQGALPAISLVTHSSLSTAYANDVDADMVFAQQVYGYAKNEDVLMGLSTSGNSKNIVNAIMVAKALGIKTIGMTGQTGGRMKGLCDVTIQVPATETYIVQEYHLPVYHCLCAMLEACFFN